MDHQTRLKAALSEAGLPTSVDEFSAEFDKHLATAGFVINNQSQVSPFYRLQKALVAEPAAQLVDAMVTQIMPNSFVLLAQDEWLDLHGESRNLPRLKEVKARGQLKLTRTDIQIEVTIPKGTIIESLPINGRVYQLRLEADCTLSIGESTKTATAIAAEPGQAYNLSENQYVRLVTDLDSITVTNEENWLITAGQDIESNDNYRARIRAAFATLGQYHVDAVYKNIIATAGGIPFDNIALEKGGPRGPGTANAYVYLTVGQISQTIIDTINNHIAAGNHGLADDMLVFAMPTQPFDLTVTITQKPNTAAVKSDVEAFIRAVFRENAAYKTTQVKPMSEFSFSQLTAELHNQFPELSKVNFDKTELITEFWLPKLRVLEARYG